MFCRFLAIKLALFWPALSVTPCSLPSRGQVLRHHVVGFVSNVSFEGITRSSGPASAKYRSVLDESMYIRCPKCLLALASVFSSAPASKTRVPMYCEAILVGCLLPSGQIDQPKDPWGLMLRLYCPPAWFALSVPHKERRREDGGKRKRKERIWDS